MTDVLVFYQHYRSASEPGGQRPQRVVNALAESGLSVVLHTTCNIPGCTARRGHFRQEANLTTVRVHVSYSQNMVPLRRTISFLSYALGCCVAVVRHRPRLIFASSTPLTVAIPGLFGKVFLRLKLVFEVRDSWPEIPIALGFLRNRLLQKIASRVEMMVYRRSDTLVALSPEIEQRIRRLTAEDVSVHFIPNMSDLRTFQNEQSSLEDFWDLPSGLTDPRGKIITYFGTLGHVNNPAFMVRLAKELADISDSYRLVCVGSGSEKERAIDEAHSTGVLDKSMFFLPQTSQRALVPLLRESLCSLSVVLPVQALFNHSSNKVFDSLAAGVPVVSNHGGWLAERVEAQGAGFTVDSTDARRAAREIDSRFSSSGVRREMSLRALALATLEFDSADQLQRLVRIVRADLTKSIT